MTGVIVMFEALLRMVHRHIILILLLNNSVRVIRNMHKNPVFASTAGAKQSRIVFARALDCHAALRLAMRGVIVTFEALLKMVHRHIILISFH